MAAKIEKNNDVSPMLMVCLLFLVHTVTNTVLLSPLAGKERCMFWNKASCSVDEHWIANWFAFGHFRVSITLWAFTYNSNGNSKSEATLSYMIAAIILVYMAEGIFAVDLLNTRLAQVQTLIFVSLLVAVAYYTAEQERCQPVIPLPRKLTTSSFDRRNKLAVSTIALSTQLVGSFFQLNEMVFGDGRHGYLGDTSSPVFQCISSMALCDMMIATVLLGVALRFFDSEQQKVVLWVQVAALLISQAMLAGETGDYMQKDQKQAGGIGMFISILAATIGAL